MEGLSKKNDTEIEDRSKVYEMQHKSLVQAQNELDELTKMRYRQLIDDETFIKEKNTLLSQITELKGKVRQTEARADNWLELTEKTFAFATYAHKAFLIGGLELKKEILLALGETPIIRSNMLVIEPNEWLVPIKNDYPALAEQYKRLELNKNQLNTRQKEALASLRAHWLRSLV